MITLLKIFLLIFLFMFLWHFATRRFLNPYKLTMIFGKKGCGKSTTLQKLGHKYQKAGWKVFCTDRTFTDFVYFPAEWVGVYKIPGDSVLLVDEVGMIWDNRNYKNFPPPVRDWFKLQRHEKCRVFMFSQTFDVDKKLRDLTDEMYLLENIFRVFSYGKRITKHTVLTIAESDRPSTIAENLAFVPFFFPGSRLLTFIPRYAKKFDSYVELALPPIPDKYPDGTPTPVL